MTIQGTREKWRRSLSSLLVPSNSSSIHQWPLTCCRFSNLVLQCLLPSVLYLFTELFWGVHPEHPWQSKCAFSEQAQQLEEMGWNLQFFPPPEACLWVYGLNFVELAVSRLYHHIILIYTLLWNNSSVFSILFNIYTHTHFSTFLMLMDCIQFQAC